jgi:hypothetical protein
MPLVLRAGRRLAHLHWLVSGAYGAADEMFSVHFESHNKLNRMGCKGSLFCISHRLMYIRSVRHGCSMFIHNRYGDASQQYPGSPLCVLLCVHHVGGILIFPAGDFLGSSSDERHKVVVEST